MTHEFTVFARCVKLFKSFPHCPPRLTLITFSLAFLRRLLMIWPRVTFQPLLPPAPSTCAPTIQSHWQSFLLPHNCLCLPLSFALDLFTSVHPVSPCHPSGSGGLIPSPSVFLLSLPHCLSQLTDHDSSRSSSLTIL